jgi:hypothetical protein
MDYIKVTAATSGGPVFVEGVFVNDLRANVIRECIAKVAELHADAVARAEALASAVTALEGMIDPMAPGSVFT